MADLSTVRSAGHPQFKVTAQPMGTGPGPDGDGQAADTSTAQRPTMRLASRPRPTTLPAHPGHDRTGRQCACSPSANLSRSQHRDPPIVTTSTPARCRNVRKPGPRPMSTRSCPASTMDATIGQPSGHRLPRRIRPDTVPSTRHAMANQKRCGQETNYGTEGTRTSWIATTTKSARRDTPSPLLWGRRLRLANQGWLRRWQHCQRDRNHGSDQAATWCRSTVQGAPRRIALLGRLRVERRANGDASSVMARRSDGAGGGRAAGWEVSDVRWLGLGGWVRLRVRALGGDGVHEVEEFVDVDRLGQERLCACLQ
jgi:hypothetical protein